MAIASSGILDRAAEHDARAGNLGDWLQLGPGPSPPASSQGGASPVVSAWRHLTPLGPLTLVVNGTTGGPRPADVLTAWRAAERELLVTPTGGPDWINLQTTVSDLRASYHRLFVERSDRT